MANITSDLWVKRNGVRYKKMFVESDSPITITCSNDAEIKMRINANAWWREEFDYNTDILAPILTIDGNEFPVGEYIITTSISESDGLKKRYRLTGYDKCYTLKKFKIENRLYYPANTLYTTIINQLLTVLGVTDFEITNSDLVLRTPREDWEPGTPYLTIINELLAEINYNSIYMGLDGKIRCMPYREAAIENVDIAYYNDPNTSILIPGATIEIDAFDHPNVFYYTCENPDADITLSVRAINDFMGNRFSIQQQGRVAKFTTIDNVPNQTILQAIADRARNESMYANDTITFSTALNPNHNPFSIIAVRKNEFFGILQELNWEMELSYRGVMTHTARRAYFD